MRRQKRNVRSLDFADVEALALRLLTPPNGDVQTPAADELHRRFRHVLVDELQDVNPRQNEILRRASRDLLAESGVGTSNLFGVGDVKQSIYGFRQAEPRLFVARDRQLRSAGATLGRVVDLQQNFRSRAPLLEAINDVFRLLMTDAAADVDYDETQQLRPGVDYPDDIDVPTFTGKPIELRLVPRDAAAPGGEIEHDASRPESPAIEDRFEREVGVVAESIRSLICDDPAHRKHVFDRGPEGLTARPIRYGDIAVLLRSAKFKSSIVADADAALASIRIAYADEPFHRAVVRYASESAGALAEALASVLATLDRWRTLIRERPIVEALSAMLAETNYRTFCAALPNGAQRLANLDALSERASAFDSFERQGLDRFLRFLSELEADDAIGRPPARVADGRRRAGDDRS